MRTEDETGLVECGNATSELQASEFSWSWMVELRFVRFGGHRFCLGRVFASAVWLRQMWLDQVGGALPT